MATQPATSSRDMHVRLTYSDVATVTLVAEGVSYSPDALADMCNRAVNVLAEALLVIEPYERATLSMGTDDEDDDEDE